MAFTRIFAKLYDNKDSNIFLIQTNPGQFTTLVCTGQSSFSNSIMSVCNWVTVPSTQAHLESLSREIESFF